jgi:hypothetical protein
LWQFIFVQVFCGPGSYFFQKLIRKLFLYEPTLKIKTKKYYFVVLFCHYIRLKWTVVKSYFLYLYLKLQHNKKNTLKNRRDPCEASIASYRSQLFFKTSKSVEIWVCRPSEHVKRVTLMWLSKLGPCPIFRHSRGKNFLATMPCWNQIFDFCMA